MTSQEERPYLTGILNYIEGIVREEGSVNAASRAIGMPQATLHSICRGAEPTLFTLHLIATYKRMPLWKLLREAQRSNHDQGSNLHPRQRISIPHPPSR